MFYKTFIKMCIGALLACVQVHPMCAVPVEARRGRWIQMELSLELDIQMFVSCKEGAGANSSFSGRAVNYSSPLSHLSNPVDSL